MTEALRRALRAISGRRGREYRIDRNQRLKVPAEWGGRTGEAVYQYVTPDGDLLVSRRDYRP